MLQRGEGSQACVQEEGNHQEWCPTLDRRAALRLLGIDAVLAGDRPAVRVSDRPESCFAMSVGGEILVGGRKLVGSAQVRRGDAFLQHGSILLAGSQEKVSTRGGETTLSAVLGRAVTVEEVTAAIVANWGEAPQNVRPSGRQTVRPLRQ